MFSVARGALGQVFNYTVLSMFYNKTSQLELLNIIIDISIQIHCNKLE